MTNDGPPTAGVFRRDLLRRAAFAGAALALTGPPALSLAGPSDERGADATPKAAIEKLFAGNRRFTQGRILAPDRELARVKQVAEKQTPFAAILGCSDSRVPVEIVFDQGFGELFVVRVAGNLASSVEIASLEFGAAVLGARAVLVLGHAKCGAVKAALEGGAVPGQISTLYQHMVPAIERGRTDLDDAIRANVRLQAPKLKDGSPVIAGLIESGKLEVAGGYYDLSTGVVSPVDV